MKTCDHCQGTGKHYARFLGAWHHQGGVETTVSFWVPSNITTPEIVNTPCQRCKGTGSLHYVDIRRNHTGRIVVITNDATYALRTIGL